MKVIAVVGTRPEAIKMAPVIFELRRKVQTLVCITGQHRDMIAQALAVFDISPDITLDSMRPGQSLNMLASRLLVGIDDVLDRERPDWVLAQGDTTSALCASLAAFQRQIKVGHVEAGLRTGDLRSPFPEEGNRSLIARIANIHFAPTRTAADALLREGVAKSKIFVTGNTIVDSIELIRAEWRSASPQISEDILHLTAAKPFVLVTCHRRENFGKVLEGICIMLKSLATRYSGFQWIFPVHLNPNVRGPVSQILHGIPNISLIEPVDYRTSLFLISRSTLIISDSGGIQEEAPSFAVPVVVMREHTERVEGVTAGFATLAGQSPAAIEEAAMTWLDDHARHADLRGRPNPYGDGGASQRIVARLLDEPIEEFHD
ncbi:non-hydrolyzing UDP-N-acetylglucosamine 2-epimerase [Rhizobium sp. IMFF44]|uniref:non-hydrolyzing UDP-N-acetylglucosamine 2-epimerase n=1 Tax=Rhizobium sp. IMFF44 TaxID=3342350 RepID=UPI0035B83C5F